ncbi:MAG: DUF421 domain-containing protein [Anaerolineae bacterium]|nr:DUF421 domain-containing protein [Anaerolineae bacterium]
MDAILNQLVELNPLSLAAVALRTLVIYVVVLVGLRLFGKRQLSQITPYDLVVILLISNAVQNAMVGPDTSLTAGLVAAFTLLIVNWGVSRLVLTNQNVAQIMIGQPVLLVHAGEFVQENLMREGILPDEVLAAMREHGIAELADVGMAVLEVDGSISFVPSGADVRRTRRVRGRKPKDS